jgi:hypothetical protein
VNLLDKPDVRIVSVTVEGIEILNTQLSTPRQGSNGVVNSIRPPS